MSVSLNHTIVLAADREQAATFFVDLFGLPPFTVWQWFHTVELDEGTHIDFADGPDDIPPQHYAFLVDDERFDRLYAKLIERNIDHWADPARRRPGEHNTDHGGRGVYFLDPSGHFMEALTRPYGSAD